jgi:AraC-like DNA-binding protein
MWQQVYILSFPDSGFLMPKAAREYNTYVKHTLEVLRSQGVDVQPLLDRHGIDEAALDGEKNLISQAQYSRLRDEMIRRYPLPGLGLLDGRGVNLLDHGLLGYAMFASASLGKAIERHSKYQDVIGAVLHTALIIEGDTAHLRIVSIARPDMVNTEAKLHYELESLFTQWAEIGPAIGSDKHWFSSVEFTYPPPGYKSMYADVLGEPVLFGREHNQMNFPAALLQRPLNFANEEAASLCEQQCAALLSELQQTEGVVGEIRRLLANCLGRYPSIEDAASTLAMGERTLRRRLVEEDTTYKQVVLDFRMELAAGYLRGREMAIQEVAYVTGYADPSNFHRTFSRYYDMTPNAYRRQYESEQADRQAKPSARYSINRQ